MDIFLTILINVIAVAIAPFFAEIITNYIKQRRYRRECYKLKNIFLKDLKEYLKFCNDIKENNSKKFKSLKFYPCYYVSESIKEGNLIIICNIDFDHFIKSNRDYSWKYLSRTGTLRSLFQEIELIPYTWEWSEMGKEHQKKCDYFFKKKPSKTHESFNIRYFSIFPKKNLFNLLIKEILISKIRNFFWPKRNGLQFFYNSLKAKIKNFENLLLNKKDEQNNKLERLTYQIQRFHGDNNKLIFQKDETEIEEIYNRMKKYEFESTTLKKLLTKDNLSFFKEKSEIEADLIKIKLDLQNIKNKSKFKIFFSRELKKYLKKFLRKLKLNKVKN